MGTMEVMFENDEGEEITLTLPSKKEVCSECDGSGYVLRGGLRGAAFSREEFEEEFSDEEDREAYFTRGGKYDETCDHCHGKNVVDVVDEEHIPADKKADYEAWLESDNARKQDEADDRRTMRQEDGDYGGGY